jgi:2-polyprenyl-3-methyl-5-hydroxy-6-metoxy-1,4-benzoquinol methylase
MLNRILPPNSSARHTLRLLSTRLNFAATRALRRKFTQPTAEGVDQLRTFLRAVYIPSWYEGIDLERFQDSEEGRATLHMHLSQRLQLHRYQFVPWINSVLPLNGARILEIGCGTGSASVSLAEQGAKVTALDLHAEALQATDLRARIHRLDITCVQGNAQQLDTLFDAGQFDMIVFFAVLEHMTLGERQISLQQAWALLKKGQFLCVADTPNRLWFYDSHTAHMPFFHWLPDELAFAYSKNSPRFPFNTQFREPSGEAMLTLIRAGRGVSYHELDLALGFSPKIISDQTAFLAARNPAKFLKRILARDASRERLLNSYAPERHRAFFRDSLNLIATKHSAQS